MEFEEGYIYNMHENDGRRERERGASAVASKAGSSAAWELLDWA